MIPRMGSAVEVVSSVTRKSAVRGFTRSSNVKVLWESMAASFGFWLNIARKLEAVIRILLRVLSADDRHCFKATFVVLSGIAGRRRILTWVAEAHTLKSDQFRMLTCSIFGKASSITAPVPFCQNAPVSGQNGSLACRL